MKLKKIFTTVLSSTIIITSLLGCTTANANGLNIVKSTITNINSINEVEGQNIKFVSLNDLEINSQNNIYSDFDWKKEKYEEINLNQGSVKINKSGIYVLTGKLEDGSITVDIDKNIDKNTVYLVLNNVNINSNNSTPINIVEAKDVVIILEKDSINFVTQGKIITEDLEFPSASIFSKTDLVISGEGTLDITTEYNDGITSKDDLFIYDGIINIKTVGDGIVAKDLLTIEKGTIKIDSGKDGIKTTNKEDEGQGNILIIDGKFNITANNDAIQSSKSLEIKNGSFNIISGGGYPDKSIKISNNFGRQGTKENPLPQTTLDLNTESTKGLKAEESILIQDGEFNISSYEDAIHSNNNVTINNGVLNIKTGDDGINADKKITINNGQINITNSYEGIESSIIEINNGKINIISTDDGINISDTTGVLTINDGEINIKTGGDSIDSNGNIVQNGGKIIIDTTSIGQMDNAIDYDGIFTNNGGTIVDQNGNPINHQSGMPGGKGFEGRKNRPLN